MTDAAAPSTAGPGQALVLAPPAPVAVVEPEAAAGSVPVDAAAQEQIRSTAVAFVQDLMTIDHRSPDFTEKVSAVTSMGDAEMRESANVSSRMLERPAAALNGGRSGGKDAQTRVAGTLAELRGTRSPNWIPTGPSSPVIKKVLKWIPGGNKIDAYFQPSTSRRRANSTTSSCSALLGLRPPRAGQGQREHRGREGQHVDADGQAR